MIARRTLAIVGAVLMGGLLVDVATAQNGDAATATVLEVRGRAFFRSGAQENWRPLQANQQLAAGAEVHTLPRSVVRMRIGVNSTILLESNSKIGIDQLLKRPDTQTLETRITKPYGTIQVKVDKAGDLRNDYQLATPSTVNAVRGTEWRQHEYRDFRETTWEQGQGEEESDDGEFTMVAGANTQEDDPDPTSKPDELIKPIDEGGLGTKNDPVFQTIDELSATNSRNSTFDNIVPGGFNPGGNPAETPPPPGGFNPGGNPAE